MLIRSSRYQQVVTDSEAQQALAFRQAFPDAAAPVNVRARLDAEYRSLGITSRWRTHRGRQFFCFAILLAHVPSSANVDISRAAINGSRFRLEGTTGSPDQANAIVTAIGAATSAKLEPGSFQTAPNGVCSFVIQSAIPRTDYRARRAGGP